MNDTGMQQERAPVSNFCQQFMHMNCDTNLLVCGCSCHGSLSITRELNPTPPVPEHDAVNHPDHYNSHPSGVEVIEIVRWMGYNRGNAVKYILRAGHKVGADEIEDLQKAAWYINDEILRLQKIRTDDEAAYNRGEYYEDSLGNRGVGGLKSDG